MHHCKKHDICWNASPSNILSGKGCPECGKEKNKIKFTKSQEEYIKQVQKINPNIEVLEKYKGANIPILHLCKKHSIEWMAIPTNILKGYGCPKCKSEKIINSNLKDHEWYIEQLRQKSIPVLAVEEYKGMKIPIKHYCITHNEYWLATPSNVLYGKGCPRCKSDKIRSALAKSHEDYVNEVTIKRSDIEVVGNYINSTTKILHRCLKHNVLWETTPINILKGCGCPQCLKEKINIKNTITPKEYQDKLQLVNPSVIALEQYADMKTPILHKCIIHDYEWFTTPGSVLQGCGCPKCRSEKIGNNLRKTHNEYVEELKNTNPYVITLEQYIDSKTSILHKCLKDGYEWYAKPSNILSGFGCPRCHESKGENKICLWLDKHNILYEHQKIFDDCKDIRPLPFDFYLPDYNTCVEYDGKQHYEPIEYFGGEEYFKYIKDHDEIKNNYCKNKGISLLRIPYFKSIEEELNNFLFI